MTANIDALAMRRSERRSTAARVTADAYLAIDELAARRRTDDPRKTHVTTDAYLTIDELAARRAGQMILESLTRPPTPTSRSTSSPHGAVDR